MNFIDNFFSIAIPLLWVLAIIVTIMFVLGG